MKIIKYILLGLGSIFAIFLIFAAFTAVDSYSIKQENELFVKNFAESFSQNWDIEHVKKDLTSELINQIGTPEGKRIIKIFESYGRLVEMDDIAFKHFKSNFNGEKIIQLEFNAKYEHGLAVVTITLQEKNDIVKVHGFHIDPVTDMSKQKEFSA